MFIKIGTFYINPQTINTIGVVETMGDINTIHEVAISINGKSYSVYVGDKCGTPSPELIQEMRNSAQQLVDIIISHTNQEVITLDVPQVNVVTEGQRVSLHD